jgi:hypothetical protein
MGVAIGVAKAIERGRTTWGAGSASTGMGFDHHDRIQDSIIFTMKKIDRTLIEPRNIFLQIHLITIIETIKITLVRLYLGSIYDLFKLNTLPRNNDLDLSS